MSWTRVVSQITSSGSCESSALEQRRDDRERRRDDLDSDYGPPDVEPLEQLALSKEVQVRSAQSIGVLVDDERACSVPTSLLGVKVGDQVRVIRSSSEYALYTVEAKRLVDEPKTVRMSTAARQRMGTGTEFAASLRVPVAATNMTDAQAQAANEFVERLVDDGVSADMVVTAPHGGKIEFNTDLQAEMTTMALGCSSWICKGWRSGGGAYDRWHITSTKISPNSFPALGQIALRKFTYAISYHGKAASGILIGGAAPLALKMMLRAAILDALSDGSIEVQIADAGEPNSGTSAKNFVNWITADGKGGIQIEQGPKVRQDHWQEVANGVIDMYSQLL